MLEVESLIVAVDKCFLEESLRKVKPLSPLWDGFVPYLLRLLTHRPYVPPPPIGPARQSMSTYHNLLIHRGGWEVCPRKCPMPICASPSCGHLGCEPQTAVDDEKRSYGQLFTQFPTR